MVHLAPALEAQPDIVLKHCIYPKSRQVTISKKSTDEELPAAAAAAAAAFIPITLIINGILTVGTTEVQRCRVLLLLALRLRPSI